MSNIRNPFRIRASEHIVSDLTFLQLFGQGALDLLADDDVWNKLHIFRSAPGGGKTSLFRMFKPSTLRTLNGLSGNEDYKDLFNRLKKIGAISDAGPQVLGVSLFCNRTYANLEDLNFDVGQKNRFFLALLNSRIVLAALRGSLELKGLNYPDDLDRIYIQLPKDLNTPILLPLPCSGREMYEWASSLERKVCEALDSFSSTEANVLKGNDLLYSLYILFPGCIEIDSKPVAIRSLLMFDDVQYLTRLQREKLYEMFFELRLPIGIWVAERLEALSTEDLLSIGVIQGRDYGEPIILEEFWRKEGVKKFESIVTNIADLRAKSAPDVQISSFDSRLENSFDDNIWHEKFSEIFQTISTRVRKKVESKPRYQSLLKGPTESHGSEYQRALSWRSTEIIIDRDLLKQKHQKKLFEIPSEGDTFENPDLECQEDSALRSAAEIFISKEFNVPYYFGFPRLAFISSYNFDQFLSLAGDLFEEILSAEKLKKTAILTPKRQEEILVKIAKKRYLEIPRRVPNGNEVQKLLDFIGQLSYVETYRANAPYSPGVTGIAITMDERMKLIELGLKEKNPRYYRLATTLSACISYNLLEPSLDRVQGKKGKKWMILNLNRLLCVYYRLPLQYGGWRPKKIDELAKWIDPGYPLQQKNIGDLI